MSKQETFKRLLAGEYDDARHVMIDCDLELLEQMRTYGWFAYSRPLSKRGAGSVYYQEGSAEWNIDIRRALETLQRV